MFDVFAVPAGVPTSNNADSASLSGLPTDDDVSEAVPAQPAKTHSAEVDVEYAAADGDAAEASVAEADAAQPAQPATVNNMMQVSSTLSKQTVCTAHAYSMGLNLQHEVCTSWHLQAWAIFGQNGCCLWLTHAVNMVLLRIARTALQVTTHTCECQQIKTASCCLVALV